MTPDEALRYLEEHTNLERMGSGSKPEEPRIDRMRRICAVLGDPQHAYPVIHITGTNGKGSVGRMVTALLAAQGLTVGTYASPHLERVNERISRNGEDIDDDELGRAIGAVAAVEGLAGVRPSYFEALTAAAFWWFADVAVDVAVVEVGLLGRWDATNVVDGRVAVITSVGLDHADYAGGGREAIAAEKVGIVKPGATLVLGETDPDLLPVLTGAGAERTWIRGDDYDLVTSETAVGGRMVDLRTPGATYSGLFLPVHGVHQAENAATALAAVEAFFDRALDPGTVGDGLAAVGLPGRFEVVGRQPLVVLDPAHNPAAAEAVATTLEDGFTTAGDTVLVVGTTRGHGDPADLLAALGAAEARLVVACAPDWPRAVPAEDIGAAAATLGAAVAVVPDVADAVERGLEEAGPDDAVVITGSFYVVGEARPRFRRSPT